MRNIKNITVAMCGLLSAVAYVNAQAANNVATVVIDNKTAVTAHFIYEQLAGTAEPMFGDVQTKKAETFKVSSFSDSVSGMRFVYSAGAKQCRFNVSHTTTFPGYVPTWKKDADSIGSARASCAVTIESISSQMPYNYTVRFTIQ